jgi:hypothetical protein
LGPQGLTEPSVPDPPGEVVIGHQAGQFRVYPPGLGHPLAGPAGPELGSGLGPAFADGVGAPSSLNDRFHRVVQAPVVRLELGPEGRDHVDRLEGRGDRLGGGRQGGDERHEGGGCGGER